MAATALEWQRQGRTIGVVPTMGALHEGHLSLVHASVARCDVTVVTIFVNPLQFGPREDFARYPRTFARDRRLVASARADVLFAPSTAAMCPPGFQTSIDVDRLATVWEGKSRPGHFRGAATIVAKLFALTRPTDAFFGQKDYQQVAVIKRMSADLNLPVRVHGLPTVREPDGLAMSSRNRYLSPQQRRAAPVLYEALCVGRRELLSSRRVDRAQSTMRRVIRAKPGVRLDYAAVVDAGTLEPADRAQGRLALLVATRVGRTRLIDNLLVDVP